MRRDAAHSVWVALRLHCVVELLFGAARRLLDGTARLLRLALGLGGTIAGQLANALLNLAYQLIGHALALVFASAIAKVSLVLILIRHR